MKIVVTGANGFIGQNLIPQLLKSYPKAEIICLVLEPKKLHEQVGLTILKKLKVKIMRIDLLDIKTLKKIPKSPDLLIHLAAGVDTADSDFRANDTGTKNLLNELTGLKKSSHIIYTSTAAVWSGRKNFKPLVEGDRPSPNNEYGRTKLKGEQELIKRSTINGFKLTILRLNTVYGTDPRGDKLFGMMHKYINQGSFISRLNWPGKFGIVHVLDVVKVIILCTHKPPGGKLIRTLIVSTENVSLPFISSVMHRSLGKKFKIIMVPQIVWKLLSYTKLFLSISEKIMPSYLFNILWRVSLVTNDVLSANPKKIKREFPGFGKRLFKKNGVDVLIPYENQ